MVMPELIDSYESLMFKSNMGKSISRRDLIRFKELLESSIHLVDGKLLKEMNSFLNKFTVKS